MDAMPFGKYKGRAWADVPVDYLRWVQSLPDLRPWLRQAVADELARRATPPPPRPSTGLDLRLCEMLIDAGLRSLAKRYHPDAGGSHDAMIAVTACADWLRLRVRRTASREAA